MTAKPVDTSGRLPPQVDAQGENPNLTGCRWTSTDIRLRSSKPFAVVRPRPLKFAFVRQHPPALASDSQ
jgi:hypothetical protein